MYQRTLLWAGVLAFLAVVSCDGSTPTQTRDFEPEPRAAQPEVSEPEAEEPEVSEPEMAEPEMEEPEVSEPEVPLDLEHPPASSIFDFANTCVSVGVGDDGEEMRWLVAAEDTQRFAFVANSRASSRFFLKASDLGTYLLYDKDGGYLVAQEEGSLLRKESLDSDVYLVDDAFVSGAEWVLEFSQRVSFRHQLRNRRTGRLLGESSLVDDVDDAVHLVLETEQGCVEHPEMSLDASGTIERTTYEDGTLFGFVDTHSHILSNFGFGGGGIFHGAPFHRLGVEHAMGSCGSFHGVDGRADFLGFGSGTGTTSIDLDTVISLLTTGLVPEHNHDTDGWPTFSDWPSHTSSTHQTQYYRWLERAWMSGLRLMVQHAVSNEALCQLMVNTGFQPARYGCEDMLNVDRQLVEIHNMERYIDAQSGGEGEGWFRVVETPQEAREVIAQGKLAIVLGIEVPNLFSCYLTRRPDGPVCDDTYIESELDRYYDLGVRVLFPVHKYDNAFTPGDGSKGIFEIGNFLQTGHWSNFVEDCPDIDTVFDRGTVQFGGLNQPRDAYVADAPNELIELSMNPLLDLLPYAEILQEPSLPGSWCQKGGLTDAGSTLVRGMMNRGMLLELDHLPRRSYQEVFEMLVEADYPGVGTHGNTNAGRLYELGGVSKAGFGRCADPANPGSMADRFRRRRDMTSAAGNYPAEGFGFDLNGLAGVPGPRFGPAASCSQPQENPVEYPFMSYAEDVVFLEPSMGERVVDFNVEGFIHIGMVPELIEDARRTGATDEDMDILFRSAEGYIRMWERAEERSRVLRGE